MILGVLRQERKADLLIFDGETLNMAPLRDPVKNLVYYAEMEDLHTVIIDGRTVVDQGRVLAADQGEVARRLQQAGEQMWPRMAQHDWDGRDVNQLSPLTYPSWSDNQL